jgi:hypothetical protein
MAMPQRSLPAASRHLPELHHHPKLRANRRRRRFGSGFTEQGSGLRFEAHTPQYSPELWRSYLDGALERYRHYGVERALDLPSIRDGRSTSLFFVALNDAGAVMAGVRCHGPLARSADAHVLEEYRGYAGREQVRVLLEEWIPEGVVEIKGGWVAATAPHTPDLSNALARCHMYAMRWMGARFAFCSTADHSRPRWMSTGGRVAEEITPISYPDERYSTVVLWWDRTTVAQFAAPKQLDVAKNQWAEPSHGW